MHVVVATPLNNPPGLAAYISSETVYCMSARCLAHHATFTAGVFFLCYFKHLPLTVNPELLQLLLMHALYLVLISRVEVRNLVLRCHGGSRCRAPDAAELLSNFAAARAATALRTSLRPNA